MSYRSKQEQRKARRRRKQMRAYWIWGGLAAATLVVVGLLAFGGSPSAIGEEVPVLSVDHVPEGTDPGPYNSDPPTSGRHYASQYSAGFYDESEAASLPLYHEGYLVHNLEHGYVIFWYNCGLLEPAKCDELKAQLQSVLQQFDGFKVIAFPRASIDVPVVATSWGRMLRFESFDPELAAEFVRRNRGRAPEPNAP